MEIIYFMIPMALILVGVIVWIFFWSVRSGQFDDLEGPAHEILMDDDDTRDKNPENESDKTES